MGKTADLAPTPFRWHASLKQEERDEGREEQEVVKWVSARGKTGVRPSDVGPKDGEKHHRLAQEERTAPRPCRRTVTAAADANSLLSEKKAFEAGPGDRTRKGGRTNVESREEKSS